MAAEQYNPDTQYSAPLLYVDIISEVWDMVSPTERIDLLTKLANTIQACPCMNFEQHYSSDHLMVKFSRTKVREGYISDFVFNNPKFYSEEENKAKKRKKTSKLYNNYYNVP